MTLFENNTIYEMHDEKKGGFHIYIYFWKGIVTTYSPMPINYTRIRGLSRPAVEAKLNSSSVPVCSFSILSPTPSPLPFDTTARVYLL